MESLIRKFVDDSESLSERELTILLESLREDAGLAATLKNHLMLDHFMSCVLDMTRGDFSSQMSQRLRDEGNAEQLANDTVSAVARRSLARGARISQGTRRPRRWGAWVSVAACMAITMGVLVYNSWRSTQFTEVMAARIKATSPEVRILRHGRSVIAVVDMNILVGDRILTGKDETASFLYDREATEIRLREHTDLEIGPVHEGKRLRLETGIIDARIDPQPEREPMVVTTPQARVEVKGTAFSLAVSREGSGSTRLEVTGGRVHLMRLSDNASVDVAGGQYAVAAEGVELAALALPADSITILSEADCPKPRTHLDGALLFEDNFDAPSDNWDVVIGNPATGFEAVTENPERYLRIRTVKVRHRGFFTLHRPDKDGMEVSIAVVNPTPEEAVERKRPRDTKRFVGIRSRRPVGAERFVVEACLSLQRTGPCWIPGLEMLREHSQVLARPERREQLPIGGLDRYRWEFEPAEDAAGADVFMCRLFVDQHRASKVRGLRDIFRVTPISRRLLFTLNQSDMCVDRVTVRELLEEPAGAGRR